MLFVVLYMKLGTRNSLHEVRILEYKYWSSVTGVLVYRSYWPSYWPSYHRFDILCVDLKVIGHFLGY